MFSYRSAENKHENNNNYLKQLFNILGQVCTTL